MHWGKTPSSVLNVYSYFIERSAVSDRVSHLRALIFLAGRPTGLRPKRESKNKRAAFEFLVKIIIRHIKGSLLQELSRALASRARVGM